MKKYTLKHYDEFCRDALICPPFEDEKQIEDWFDTHKIQIIANDCVMELEYDADTVNELEFAIREIHEAILGDGTATTGNTIGSEYRPAELKDIIKIAIRSDWHDYGFKINSFAKFIQKFVADTEDFSDVIHHYNLILTDINYYNNLYKCDFGKLNMNTMKNICPSKIQDIVSKLVCIDTELIHGVDQDNKSTDTTFIMDYSLKESGDLVGWFYGEPDDGYIKQLIADYKKKLFN